MQAAEIVQEARDNSMGLPSEQALSLLAYQEGGATEDKDGFDPHAELRARVLDALQNTLSLKDRPLVRFLMEQEIACHQDEVETDSDSIHHCGFLLFLLGQLEDVELLWRAKRASFDTWCGFDIQFLVGAGVAPTLSYLQDIQEKWARHAKSYIEECQAAGDFRHLERYREAKMKYFRAVDA